MDLLFVVPPFAQIEQPSIGVSLLAAAVRRQGFSSGVLYLSVDLAGRIGSRLYNWIAERGDMLLLDTATPAISLLGEWFFADLVFPGQLPPVDEYLKRFVAPGRGSAAFIPLLLEGRRQRTDFLDNGVREIMRRNPAVVGFTTTFHQTCSSLAFAQRLKELPHPPLVVFGGANCAGEMGLQMARSFPWIDYVCTGEGDEAIPEFLRSVLANGGPAPPGMIERAAATLSVPEPVRDLDSLPLPDYSDYFAALERLPAAFKIRPRLMIETSRGCWWGEKRHCTFCGLNGQTMTYRSKSARRVVEELTALSETYGITRIESVDNILDTRYIQTLFPILARDGPKLELFYETKSNLRFEQLQTMYDGGVRAIQPGIESFSNQALRLMRKGCTGAQNLQILRWSRELGIGVVWNLLYGFPAEDPAEYEKMAALLPLLTHLEPPSFCIRVRMDRFSPLYFDARRFELESVAPMPAYSYIFPLAMDELRRLAYFFEFEYGDSRKPIEYAGALVSEAARWSEIDSATAPRLDAWFAAGAVLIEDTRPARAREFYALSGLPARIYELCDTAHALAPIARQTGVSEREAAEALAFLVENRLMVDIEGQHLSLAVFRNRAPRRPAEPAHDPAALVRLGA